MWPSPELASRIYDIANFALIGSLLVGVVATVLIVWMGNTKEAYLRRELANAGRDAAQANARAAEASLELERLKAPRLMTEQQYRSLVRAMFAFKGSRVSVGALPDTFETVSLARQILLALNEAGIPADFNQGAAQVQVGVTRGVVAVFTAGNKKGETFASAFARTMNEIGIDTGAESGLMERLMPIMEKDDPAIRSKHDWVIIVVGDKH